MAFARNGTEIVYCDSRRAGSRRDWTRREVVDVGEHDRQPEPLDDFDLVVEESRRPRRHRSREVPDEEHDLLRIGEPFAEPPPDGFRLAGVERYVQVMGVVEIEFDALVLLPRAHDAVVVDVFTLAKLTNVLLR